jgi:DNA repair protein RadA/Sms
MYTGAWDECFGFPSDPSKKEPGIVRTSASLIGGAPGAGKSTLVLQIANAVAGRYGEVIYLMAEEALPEVKMRADRLQLTNVRPIRMVNALSGNVSLRDVVNARVKNAGHRPYLVLVDSLQSLVGSDDALQLEVCKACKEFATSLHAPFIIVSHVTKEEVIAGKLALQHQVDTTMTFFADDMGIRVLHVEKNRFGRAHVEKEFLMTEKGLFPVPESDETEDDEDDENE